MFSDGYIHDIHLLSINIVGVCWKIDICSKVRYIRSVVYFSSEYFGENNVTRKTNAVIVLGY